MPKTRSKKTLANENEKLIPSSSSSSSLSDHEETEMYYFNLTYFHIYRKLLFFRAGKEGNMLLPVRWKSSQIKTPNILVKCF
jgi:hypothetical protein